jgi:hypothetical protein
VSTERVARDTQLTHHRPVRPSLCARTVCATLIALFVVLAFEVRAAAQDVACEQQAEARALFTVARESAQGGLWADAVDGFRRSYALCALTATRFNLAVALRALGRHLEARDVLRDILEEHGDELGDAQRREAERLLADEAERIAQLVVRGLVEGATHTVEIDHEERADDGERPLVFDLDPGAHRLSIARPGVEAFEWAGNLSEGQRLDLDVDLREAPEEGGTGTGPVPDHPRDDDSGGLGAAFWIIIAVVIVGAAAAITAGVVLSQPELVEPASDRRYVL